VKRETMKRDPLRSMFVWDNHGCMPLRPADERFLPQLERYRRSHVNVVGINAGFDGVPWQNTLQMLAALRSWLRRHPQRYMMVGTAGDFVSLGKRLGVFFDIEGGAALDGQLGMVELYRDLGVRWMLIAYNRNNALGGGCQDRDRGLTRFGRAVVAEMERVGMTVCCSHTGYRTTMDVMSAARKPVIFSHSNPLGIWRHKRNVRDSAIRACAASGGVVGINGIGTFLGANDNRPETVARHIDYVAGLVGIEHVGLGLDYVFDAQELDDFVKSHPEMFPASDGYAQGVCMVAPERTGEIATELAKLGYRTPELRQVMGGNFLRVAKATWPTQRAS